jgi:hypothetical protein
MARGGSSGNDFQNPGGPSASQPDEILKFERDEWTTLRTVEGLQQKAGVPKTKLRRLVLKELVDNALDTGARARIGPLPGGGYFIEDDGGGFAGSPEEIAHLFSIGRRMISTKRLRLPTRGALGNGLRVVAGAVLASKGFLTVTTRNRRIELRPERDGTTTVVKVEPVDFPIGTRIEIGFGPDIPEDTNATYWATIAIMMARGQTYSGKSSPWWYDVPQFHELLDESGDKLVRELVAELDGCTGGRAGEIVNEAGLARMTCREVTSEQAATLLQVARDYVKEVKPRRLGAAGPELFRNYAHALVTGSAVIGTEPSAEIPFVVEAWAKENATMRLDVCVNRTPVTGDITARRDKRDINFFGCGLLDKVADAPRKPNFIIWLNVITPYMPITSDGKEPNLEPFLDEISSAVQKAVRKARNPKAKGEGSQKDIVLAHLADAIAEQGGMLFGERQLLYFLRPIVMNEIGEELKTGNFKKIITKYENDLGEIPKMYREARGSIYHPHRGDTLPLGTLTVQQYERPFWTYNKLVYIEKEGAIEALKEMRWPERHDCCVISSKGFSTRAAKDLIDKLVEHDEPVEVFCVTDADAPGGMIYQTLQNETQARKARKIKIINLGLDPWEALAMGLEVENVEQGEDRKAVADHVRERTDRDWGEWLQTHRVELNAMSTPRLIAWLDEKMAAFGRSGKLIPPHEVLETDLAERIDSKVREAVTERILREAGAEAQIADAIAAITPPDGATLAEGIQQLFEDEPDREWRDHVEDVAKRLT